MKRLNYIYALVPLYAVLGFVRTIEAWLDPWGALVVGGLLSLAVWALVWMRLYAGGRLRPELGVLSVLPVFCYLGLKVGGEEAVACFADPSWQNLYFLTWCAAAFVLILSVRCTPEEVKEQGDNKRAGGITVILGAFIVLISFLTWMATAADLFAPFLK